MGARTMVVFLIVLSLLPLVAGQYSLESLELTVYADGYVKVVQVILPENYTVSAAVPLLAGNVEGLTVVDSGGNPLPYEVNGTKLIVYFENATSIKITYYTPDLTSKNGAIWSVHFFSEVPVRINFPENAVIVDLTDIPIKINGNSILMPAGNQTVSYVLEYRSAKGTTTESPNAAIPSSSDQVTSTPNRSPTNWVLVEALVLLAMVAGAVFVYTKGVGGRNTLGISREEFEKRLKEYELTKEEEKALLYLFDRGGRAKQSEVREMLGIPKTTAWRMFQRLEKQGLVRVYKRRRENWVELRL